MRTFGIVLLVLGLLLCLTIIGAGLGGLMVIVGLILIAIGGGQRRTVIHNTVQVVHAPQSARQADFGDDIQPSAKVLLSEPRLVPPRKVIDIAERPFADLGKEITPSARKVLVEAQREGFEIAFQRDRVTITADSGDVILRSNLAIERFGRRQGYLD